MARHKDVDWNLPEGTPAGRSTTHSWDAIHAALLMDLRDELRAMRRRLDCHETIAMPRYLRRVALAVEKLQQRRRRRTKK